VGEGGGGWLGWHKRRKSLPGGGGGVMGRADVLQRASNERCQAYKGVLRPRGRDRPSGDGTQVGSGCSLMRPQQLI
jgi:hypothetical protein